MNLTICSFLTISVIRTPHVLKIDGFVAGPELIGKPSVWHALLNTICRAETSVSRSVYETIVTDLPLNHNDSGISGCHLSVQPSVQWTERRVPDRRNSDLDLTLKRFDVLLCVHSLQYVRRYRNVSLSNIIFNIIASIL